MRLQIPQHIRRHLRGLRRGDHHPVLLPHFQVTDEGIRTLDAAPEPVESPVAGALRLCDGSRTLRDVARAGGVSRATLIEQHDLGRIILWKSPLAGSGGQSTDPPGVVIVSPHPDDAPLSAYAGCSTGRALIVNVFTRTTWSRFPALLRTPEDVQRIREAEERCMASLLAARLYMMGLPEALLRGYAMESVFGEPVEERDAAVRQTVVAGMTVLAFRHLRARWLLPLGVGNHVDHRLVRDASMEALRSAGVAMDQIEFYEDLPYAAEITGVPDFFNFWPQQGRLRVAGTHRVAAHEKMELLRVYWSQLTWSQIGRVGEYGNRVGRGESVERSWALAP